MGKKNKLKPTYVDFDHKNYKWKSDIMGLLVVVDIIIIVVVLNGLKKMENGKFYHLIEMKKGF